MITKLLYMYDTYLYESEAYIENVGKDEKGNYIILDQTIFYPQGGGQPSDIGEIIYNNISIPINFVKSVDEVRHYTQFDNLIEVKGQKVVIKIDEARRILNARYHTAGHLIGNTVEKLIPQIAAIKGHQFPGEAYVEFNKEIEFNNDNFINILNQEISEAINSEKAINSKVIDSQEFNKIFSILPYDIESNKILRMVVIEGYKPTPCGGTHIKNLLEIKNIKITKIKSKCGKTRINYELYE